MKLTFLIEMVLETLKNSRDLCTDYLWTMFRINFESVIDTLFELLLWMKTFYVNELDAINMVLLI